MAEPQNGEDREYVQVTHRGVRHQAHVEETDRGTGKKRFLVLQPLSAGGPAEWHDLESAEGKEWAAVHDAEAGHLVRGEKRKDEKDDESRDSETPRLRELREQAARESAEASVRMSHDESEPSAESAGFGAGRPF